MTQLFIDNQEVALPEDFSFDLIRENPFFTKGGSFTLDISINLDIPINARLYKHLNRFTASSVFKKRPARLLVDCQTVLNGTEIILEVNELSASIQLASGNSELNFIAGEDMKMSDLNMGIVPVLSIDQAKKSMSMSYPECDYVCAPAKARNGSEVIFLNNLPEQILYFNKSMNTIIWENSHKAEPSEIRPMPYLNFIVEKCIEALGYTIQRNILRETVYNRLFIVHGSKPSTWSELFGKKTIVEFLSDVEYLFGVNIVVLSGKSVDILFRNDFYDNHASVFCPKMVEDRFERVYLSEDEQIVSYDKSDISYELQDNSYFKMQNIDQEIRCELPEVHQASLDGLKNLIKSANEQDLAKLYRCILIDDETSTEFILIKDENLGAHLNIVNRFGAIIRQRNKNEIKLNIVPVEIEYPNILFQYYIKDLTGKENIIGTSKGHITLPVVEKYVFSDEVGITAEEAINGKEIASQEVERISVAFWNGCKKIDMVVGEGAPIFPLPTTHYIAPWIYNYYKPLDETKASLSLPYINKDIYQNTTLFDVEKEHTIHALLESNIPSATDIWNVNNKKHICKSIQLKITPNGFDPEYQATLYTMI